MQNRKNNSVKPFVSYVYENHKGTKLPIACLVLGLNQNTNELVFGISTPNPHDVQKGLITFSKSKMKEIATERMKIGQHVFYNRNRTFLNFRNNFHDFLGEELYENVEYLLKKIGKYYKLSDIQTENLLEKFNEENFN